MVTAHIHFLSSLARLSPRTPLPGVSLPVEAGPIPGQQSEPVVAAWGRPAVAQELFPLISTSFICPRPAIYPLVLPPPVDQRRAHFHRAQSAEAEQMAPLCFCPLSLRHSRFKCSHKSSDKSPSFMGYLWKITILSLSLVPCFVVTI